LRLKKIPHPNPPFVKGGTKRGIYKLRRCVGALQNKSPLNSPFVKGGDKIGDLKAPTLRRSPTKQIPPTSLW